MQRGTMQKTVDILARFIKSLGLPFGQRVMAQRKRRAHPFMTDIVPNNEPKVKFCLNVTPRERLPSGLLIWKVFNL